MSWSKQYPVNFVVDGDTTAEALAKHISEFERIYTLLNRVRNLDGGAVAPTDPESGALWIDSSGANGSVLKHYSGTAWAELNIGQNPIGAVIMYNGVVSSIPANWQLCDGTNGTPDLAGKFVYGTNIEGEIGNTGGTADSIVVEHTHNVEHTHDIQHTHDATTESNGAHTHFTAGYSTIDNYDVSSTIAINTFDAFEGNLNGTNDPIDRGPTSSNGAHTHTLTTSSISTNDSGNSSITEAVSTGVSGTDTNLPPYVKLAYIQRMS